MMYFKLSQLFIISFICCVVGIYPSRLIAQNLDDDAAIETPPVHFTNNCQILSNRQILILTMQKMNWLIQPVKKSGAVRKVLN